MLQALLEARFKLKLRQETKEGAVYELTVAKNGTKMRPIVDGSCVTRDPDQIPLPPKAPDGKHWCSTFNYVSSRRTMTGILDGYGVTAAELAPRLSSDGRPIIDKTGLKGMFDFHLEYQREGGPPPEDTDLAHAAPSVLAAVQEQLGLKLIPARGIIKTLAIDHVEKPSEN